MNPHSYARRQSGKKRGQYRMCKYCFNESVRNQGLCLECSQRSKEENKQRLAIANATATLSDFLWQKNISAKNMKTIKRYCESEDVELREFASLLLAIAMQFPRRKKRFPRMRQQAPELYQRIRQNQYFVWLEDETTCETELNRELSRSLNHDQAGNDEDAVLDLCDRLEYAERTGDDTHPEIMW